MISREKMMENFSLPRETHPERIYVLKNLGETKGLTILDLGCGNNKTMPNIVGIDLYKTPEPSLIGSLDELPVKTETVDILISRHSLEHMVDPVKTLWEWDRVLKMGGKVIIILPDHGENDTLSKEIGNGLHFHAYTRESFKNFLTMFTYFKLEKLETVMPEWSFGGVFTKIA